jgi:hypothetical protein
MDAAVFVGLFNVFIGLMLVASVLLMGGGFVIWIARLGVWPSYRDDAIHAMQWGVATLFTLVLILAVVRLVQNYTDTAMFLVGVLVIFAVVVIAIRVALGYHKAADDEDEH